jgi:hypothetical protein
VGRRTSTLRLVAVVAAFATAGAVALACGAFTGADQSADVDASDASDAPFDSTEVGTTDGANDAPLTDAGKTTLDADASEDAGFDAPPGDANRTGFWFVTSMGYPTGTPYPTGFASPADADALCGSVAEKAGQAFLHGRRWLAYLGAVGLDPKDRMAPGAFVQYQRPDYQVIGSIDEMLNASVVALPVPPSVHENGLDDMGVQVWTGSHSGGTLDNSCNGWTWGDGSVQAMTGNSGNNDSNWVHNQNMGCDGQYALYCVEQR